MTSDRFRFHNNNKERGNTGETPGKHRGNTGERKIKYNDMTSDWYFIRSFVIYLVGKDRGKTYVIKVRGDKFIRYVIPHRGITGEVPRCFPDLFLTVYGHFLIYNFVPKALCNMGPGVSMCLSLNYIYSGWSFSSFAYLQCAKIVHICSYPMRVFTESPNDITFLHIIICKPHIRVKWIRSL